MPLIAVVPAAFLSACVSAGSDRPIPEAAVVAALNRVCPTPTPGSVKSKIADELEAAINQGVPPDVLAAEWERLDEGASRCRRK